MNRTAIFLCLSFAAKGTYALPLACLIEPERIAEVGVPTIGIIERIPVERGDEVKKDQIVAYLKSDVERASVNLAAVRAQAEAESRVAAAAHEIAQSKLARARRLVAVGFVSQEAVDQAEFEARIAENRLQQARENQAIWQRELDISQSHLAQRVVRSPFAGVVIERYRTEGERVEREPILRLAKLDPLRVEVILPAAHFGRVQPGSGAVISTSLPGAAEIQAKVVLVDRFIDAASNTFRVRLLLPNPGNKLPPGLRCSARFEDLAQSGNGRNPPSAAEIQSEAALQPAKSAHLRPQ